MSDAATADRLPEDLAEALEGARLGGSRIGQPVIFLPSTPSTNDVASRLAAAGAPDGTTVVADTQTAGRGRLGRAWFSPPGTGLYVSVVVRLDPPGGRAACDPLMAPVPAPARLTLLAGVALAEAVRRATGLPVELKWPNDLVFCGRKLAGILAEASAQDGVLDYIVLGIGINVRLVRFPPEIAARASSLEAELGRTVDRGAVLASLLANLADARDALNGHRPAGSGAAADPDGRGVGAWLERWRRLSPSATGAPVEWRTPAGPRRGRTCGLDDDGTLLVGTGSGVERVVAGEIIWL